MIDTQSSTVEYPLYEIQMPSGRSNFFHASEVTRVDDQDHGRRKFFE
ncbi:MAG: hypothetical protein GWN39_20580 [Thermoplasmata archaeon]|nr:hypothetical protein [Thermoplasmata archaeon]